ncbi:MAG: hypothetical protein LBL31_02530 [Spirochaetaceae bacterium]|nr:hypothetical protein [Spirochaetaceae bacterium]
MAAGNGRLPAGREAAIATVGARVALCAARAAVTQGFIKGAANGRE